MLTTLTKIRTQFGKSFNNLCWSKGVKKLSNKWIRYFFIMVTVGSKGRNWIVTATIWEVEASIWDFAAAMRSDAEALWAIASFAWVKHLMRGIL